MPPPLFLPIVIAITRESLRHAHVSTIAVGLTPFEVENMSVDNMIVNNYYNRFRTYSRLQHQDISPGSERSKCEIEV